MLATCLTESLESFVSWFIMSSNFCVSGGEEYAWDGKGRGFESDQDFFFKLNDIFTELFLSKKCQPLVVCLCFVGFVATSY